MKIIFKPRFVSKEKPSTIQTYLSKHPTSLLTTKLSVLSIMAENIGEEDLA
jgi:hypothetical protein